MRIRHSNRAVKVELLFDGQRFTARAGESVAAALFASGVRALRTSPHLREARGMFCLMGSCQECLVMVDGRRVLACQTPVTDGLRVETVAETGANV
jgi:D-hydroxyproline dehydrogenase subunit gamma